MKQWPDFDSNGDLPLGIHQATITEVLQHFGTSTLQRQVVASRLERIYKLARSTGQVARFVIFGSFVTAKPAPNDVDIFMLMEAVGRNKAANGDRFRHAHECRKRSASSAYSGLQPATTASAGD